MQASSAPCDIGIKDYCMLNCFFGVFLFFQKEKVYIGKLNMILVQVRCVSAYMHALVWYNVVFSRLNWESLSQCVVLPDNLGEEWSRCVWRVFEWVYVCVSEGMCAWVSVCVHDSVRVCFTVWLMEYSCMNAFALVLLRMSHSLISEESPDVNPVWSGHRPAHVQYVCL